MSEETVPDRSLRATTREVVFGHETPAGKTFDVVLILAIIASVIAVMLESVEEFRLAYGPVLRGVEWGFTLLFTLEYVTRLWCDPADHWLQGHAVWHVLSALSLYVLFLFYSRLPADSAAAGPGTIPEPR